VPTVINIHEAKTHLSRLLQRAAAGEDIVIAKAGEPLVRLVPYQAEVTRRIPGAWKDKGWIADDFDDPLPEEVLGTFYGDIEAGIDGDA